MDDLISRQAAIDVIDKYNFDYPQYMERFVTELRDAMKADLKDDIKDLPSAQPEPKEGHWIPQETPDGGEQYECSECGVLWEFNDGTPEDNEAYFCPKCGTKLKGETT